MIHTGIWMPCHFNPAQDNSDRPFKLQSSLCGWLKLLIDKYRSLTFFLSPNPFLALPSIGIDYKDTT